MAEKIDANFSACNLLDSLIKALWQTYALNKHEVMNVACSRQKHREMPWECNTPITIEVLNLGKGEKRHCVYTSCGLTTVVIKPS